MLTLERKGPHEHGPVHALHPLHTPLQTSTASSRARRASGRRIICDRFALGPVAFELIGDRALMLEPEPMRYRRRPDEHPLVADVICSVTVDPALTGLSPYGTFTVERVHSKGIERKGIERKGIERKGIERDGIELLLRAPRAHCSLRHVAPQRYACSARIAGHPSALTSLLHMVGAAIVEAEGGLVLHAAGIELDGRAVLFVGPSGAGKSTAATLTHGASMFAYDHVAVLPMDAAGVLDHAGGRYQGVAALAYGLPGGSPARMTQTSHMVLPLAGLFRVVQAEEDIQGTPHRGTRAERFSGARALFIVRESVESADVSLEGEQARLRASSAIASAQSVSVGALHTVLGASIAPLLRELLEERA